MNKIMFAVLLLIPALVLAQPPRYASNRPADEAFLANPKETPSLIRWIVVDDPDSECRAYRGEQANENRRSGPVRACARWTSKTCTIITGPETSHGILGHELRHCFEGRFHD